MYFSASSIPTFWTLTDLTLHCPHIEDDWDYCVGLERLCTVESGRTVK